MWRTERFWKGRSCEDHAFVITNLIQDRIDQRKSTYVSFIDFEKAFDWINRDLLLYKLIMNGIDGKFYFAIKSLYCQTSSCVKLNNILSSSFNTISGVRQGNNLSPTLFNIFINDLSNELKLLLLVYISVRIWYHLIFYTRTTYFNSWKWSRLAGIA